MKKLVLKFATDRFSRFREILVTDFKNTVLRKTRLKFTIGIYNRPVNERNSLLGMRCHSDLLSNARTRLHKYACNFENNRRIDLKFSVCVLKYMYIRKIKLKKIDFLKILTVYNIKNCKQLFSLRNTYSGGDVRIMCCYFLDFKCKQWWKKLFTVFDTDWVRGRWGGVCFTSS